MGIDNLHTLERHVFAGSGAFNLSQLPDRDIDLGFTEELGYGAGQLSPSHVSVMSQDPVISGGTTEIARFLTNIDALVGLAIPSTTVITSVAFYFQSAQLLGGIKAGSTHLSGTINKGMVIPSEVSVEQSGVATMTFDLHALYDGTNLPIVWADSQALASGTPAVDEQFTLGPTFINNVQVPGLQGMTWSFGIEVEKHSTDGQVYPLTMRIIRVTPMITLRTNDVVTASDFALSGTALDANTFKSYLQKLDNMGDRVAIATQEHVEILGSASQGFITVENLGGANQESHVSEIKIRPIVGSAAVYTIDATAAIPAFS